jgi:hypothetical protein
VSSQYIHYTASFSRAAAAVVGSSGSSSSVRSSSSKAFAHTNTACTHGIATDMNGSTAGRPRPSAKSLQRTRTHVRQLTAHAVDVGAQTRTTHIIKPAICCTMRGYRPSARSSSLRGASSLATSIMNSAILPT